MDQIHSRLPSDGLRGPLTRVGQSTEHPQASDDHRSDGLSSGTVPLARHLRTSDPVHVFSGDSLRIEGQVVVPFSLTPASPERQAFDLAVMGMTPDQVTKFWIDRRIRGQGSPPKSAPSADVLTKVVAKFPGAMGYVPASGLNPLLKAVAIDGKSFDDPAYLDLLHHSKRHRRLHTDVARATKKRRRPRLT